MSLSLYTIESDLLELAQLRESAEYPAASHIKPQHAKEDGQSYKVAN